MDGQRVWGSMDYQSNVTGTLCIRNPAATNIQGPIDQIEWHTDPTARFKNRASSWVSIGHAQKTETKFLHSSLSSSYAKTKRYLARPFLVAGARKKNKMLSRYQVIPIIDLPSLCPFVSYEQ